MSDIFGSAASVIPNLPVPPPIDYTSRDYTSILNDLINAIPTFMPSWVDRSPGDLGIVLLELFSWMGDILNYYIDRVASEAYLATAQQLGSVLNIAQLLDYTPTGSVSAVVTLQFTIVNPSPTPVLILAGTTVQTSTVTGGVSISFQTDKDLTIWGDNTTPTGITKISNGQPGQSFALSGPYDGLTQTVKVNSVAWTNVASFSGHLGTDQVYVVNGTIVLFGDGVHGAIPPLGQTINIVYYPFSGSQYQSTVTATHGVVVTAESMGTSDGTLSQSFFLFRNPVVNNSLSVSVGGTTWTFFNRLVDAGPTDFAYTTFTDGNGRVRVLFGNGVNGLVPPPGLSLLASYRVGGGSAGNVSANTLTFLTTSIPGVAGVTNPAPAAGGADAETIDHIRAHAPLSLTAVNRAVTLQDYASLTLNLSTVAKASATSEFTTSVALYVHPAGGFVSDTSPTGLLYQRVQAVANQITNAVGNGYLDTRKMATVTIQVFGPQYNNLGVLQLGYVPVDITVAVTVLPQYRQSVVKAGVTGALAALLGFDSVDFGARITLSSVYHALQKVDGVDYCVVSVLSRHEIGPPVLGDIVCASYEIPMLNNPFLNVSVTGGITY